MKNTKSMNRMEWRQHLPSISPPVPPSRQCSPRARSCPAAAPAFPSPARHSALAAALDALPPHLFHQAALGDRAKPPTPCRPHHDTRPAAPDHTHPHVTPAVPVSREGGALARAVGTPRRARPGALPTRGVDEQGGAPHGQRGAPVACTSAVFRLGEAALAAALLRGVQRAHLPVGAKLQRRIAKAHRRVHAAQVGGDGVHVFNGRRQVGSKTGGDVRGCGGGGLGHIAILLLRRERRRGWTQPEERPPGDGRHWRHGRRRCRPRSRRRCRRRSRRRRRRRRRRDHQRRTTASEDPLRGGG